MKNYSPDIYLCVACTTSLIYFICQIVSELPSMSSVFTEIYLSQVCKHTGSHSTVKLFIEECSVRPTLSKTYLFMF